MGMSTHNWVRTRRPQGHLVTSLSFLHSLLLTNCLTRHVFHKPHKKAKMYIPNYDHIDQLVSSEHAEDDDVWAPNFIEPWV